MQRALWEKIQLERSKSSILAGNKEGHDQWGWLEQQKQRMTVLVLIVMQQSHPTTSAVLTPLV